MSSVRTPDDMRPFTVEEFFAWQETVGERCELVGGYPLRMMTGASNRHDTIVVNLIVAIQTRLRGGPCRSFTADGSVETFPGQIRRPDVGIDCGPFRPDDHKASEPTVVFEVLSPSTAGFDRLRKVEEYKAIPTLRHIVILEALRPFATLWSRVEGTEWAQTTQDGLDGVLALTAVSIELPMAELYDRVAFE